VLSGFYGAMLFLGWIDENPALIKPLRYKAVKPKVLFLP
jgi:hypothetical protein